ncbi:major intrinsic protein [Nitzschia inconspicua]|uniref:Major intrinsic protein n=1 Tax=Nitzschia inconspicua TaxID=303405 RepID=A0A9K3PE38_9STRA|nr:major intrinsic protein [Nitzschia inconspicua]
MADSDASSAAPVAAPSGLRIARASLVKAESCVNSASCVPTDDGYCLQVEQPVTATACHANSPAPVPPETPIKSNNLQRFRKLVSELLGTLLLVMIVVGSGIMGETLSEDVGVQLMINSIATLAGLYCLITTLGPISGAHFNPVVSMVDVLYGDMPMMECLWYTAVQIMGAILGALIANMMFDVPIALSTTVRFSWNLWISEILSTATLIFVIHGAIRTGQGDTVPIAVASWVGGGYFFTSSTIFANPAVTIGRIFSDTFAGIAPKSAGPFICFQIIGGLLGYGLVRFLYPSNVSSDDNMAQDDPLYRRAYVLVHQGFFDNHGYNSGTKIRTTSGPTGDASKPCGSCETDKGE